MEYTVNEDGLMAIGATVRMFEPEAKFEQRSEFWVYRDISIEAVDFDPDPTKRKYRVIIPD